MHLTPEACRQMIGLLVGMVGVQLLFGEALGRGIIALMDLFKSGPDFVDIHAEYRLKELGLPTTPAYVKVYREKYIKVFSSGDYHMFTFFAQANSFCLIFYCFLVTS